MNATSPGTSFFIELPGSKVIDLLGFCSSPSAYPHLTSLALDDHQHDLTAILSDTITHPSLHPTNLNILRGKKSWLLHVDLLVLSDNGNLHDALFIAAAAALNSTRVPRTREVEYRARTRTATGGSAGALPGSEDAPMGEEGVKQSGLDTREVRKTADFELADYWDEGEPLRCAGPWPICITLNLVSPPRRYTLPAISFCLISFKLSLR